MSSTRNTLMLGVIGILCLFLASSPLDAHCSRFTPPPRLGTPGEKVPPGPDGASTPLPPGWESTPRPKDEPDGKKAEAERPSHWTLWWELNRAKILNLDALRMRRALTAVGDDEGESPDREAICALLRSAALDSDIDLATSSIVALGKARDTGAVTLLMDLASAKRSHASVHESSLIALGLIGNRSPAVGPFLLRVLGDEARHPSIRGCAAIGLGLADAPKAADALLKRSNDPKESPEVAAACLFAFGLCRDPVPILSLGFIANGKDQPLLRTHAAMGLGRVTIGADAPTGLREAFLDEIRRLLVNGMPEARGQAALTLGALKADDAESRKLLEALLAGKGDDLDRSFAAISLGELGAAESVEPLLAAWRDPNATVAAHVALALGLLAARVPEPEARERIITLLLTQVTEQPDPDVRGALVIALALSGDRRAVKPILSLLDEVTVPFLQGVGAQALGILGVEAGCKPIRALLSGSPDPWVRRHAAWALGVMADREAEALLLGVVGKDEREYVRGQAAMALGGFRTPDAGRALAGFLSDPEAPATLKAFAAVGLGRYLDVHEGAGLGRLRDHLDHRRTGELLREVQFYY